VPLIGARITRLPSLSCGMPNPDRTTGSLTVADNFLYLLAEMERCLHRMDATWSQEQAGKVQARLFNIAFHITQLGKNEQSVH
jgi:hypothetical protein